MNKDYNYSGYTQFNFDLEMNERKRRQRKTFSRMFIGLAVYLLSFNLITISAYIIAILTYGEAAVEFLTNPVADALISAGIQYLIAFPLFLLITHKMEKSEKGEVKKLSASEFLLFFVASETFMFVGNLIGTALNTFIGSFLGAVPENAIQSAVTTTPIWLILLIMVLIGPIVEELIFRKIMIDRLSMYGSVPAILFSSVAFGLMHGNLYQFFYATFLGLILGYVYTATKNVKYTILIHMLINFLGSVVVLATQGAIEVFYEQLEAYSAGLPYDTAKLVVNGVISTLYTSFQYGLLISGAFVVIYRFTKKQIKITNDREIYLSNKDLANGGIVNTGAILFMISTVAFMVLSLF